MHYIRIILALYNYVNVTILLPVCGDYILIFVILLRCVGVPDNKYTAHLYGSLGNILILTVTVLTVTLAVL